MKNLRANSMTILSAAALVAALSGCGEADEVTVALNKAGGELTSLSPDGANAAPSETRQKTYDTVGRELEAAARAAESGTSGPAYLLAAQAKSGSAQLAHHALRPLLSDVSRLARSIQSELGAHGMSIARAEAAAAYDASRGRASVNEQITAINGSIAEARAERDDVSARIADLKDEAAGYSEEARSIRNEGDALRLRAERLDGSEERVRLITEAVELSRKADAKSKRADEIVAQADNLEPRLDLLEREVGRLSKQLASAQATLMQIDETAKGQRERARAARAKADESASVIAARTSELIGLMNGGFAVAHDALTSDYDKALSLLRQASSNGAREEARASQGVVEHAALVAERDAASGLRLAMQALENVRSAGLPVESVDAINSRLESSNARIEELRSNASSSLGSSGVRGRAGDGLSRLAERLTPMKDEMSDEMPEKPEGQ